MAAKWLEYLSTVCLDERGAMTLPNEYRKELNLEAGAPLTVLRIGDGLILMPGQERFEQLCEAIATRLEHAGITEVALQTTLPEVREKLMRRRYPKLFNKNGRRAGKSKSSVSKGRRKE